MLLLSASIRSVRGSGSAEGLRGARGQSAFVQGFVVVAAYASPKRASSSSSSGLGSCGIVGLPNVGKSCLFNALIGRAQARSENYPFCTINPSYGKAVFRDSRVSKLAEIVRPKSVTPSLVNVVDIAGLVEGASEGEGLGNLFLDNIRNVSAVIHLVRCFDLEHSPVVHTLKTVDPVRDVRIIERELVQRDLQLLQGLKRGKLPKGVPYDPRTYAALAERVHEALVRDGHVRSLRISEGSAEDEMLGHFRLLSTKPVLYVANVDEAGMAAGNAHTRALADYVAARGDSAQLVSVCASVESDLATMEDEAARQELAAMYGVDLESDEGSGVQRIVHAAFKLLRLQHYFTEGPQEVRAWPYPRGWTAKQCSGRIHSDFPSLFIRAEHWTYDDFVAAKGKRARQVFKTADYVAQDGDIFNFKLR